MKITKFGHCCLLIEENGLRILTDPGDYTTEQSTITNIDVVLITHEHKDHLHIDSVKDLVKNNPDVKIITNTSVGNILKQEHISFQVVEDGQSATVNGVAFEGFGSEHAEIYRDFNRVKNTGYFIANKLFYPGDALHNPGKSVEILALPVAGPWVKVSEVIGYGLEIKPQKCFPVHDGVLARPDTTYRLVKTFLEEQGIAFVPLELGQETEI